MSDKKPDVPAETFHTLTVGHAGSVTIDPKTGREVAELPEATPPAPPPAPQDDPDDSTKTKKVK